MWLLKLMHRFILNKKQKEERSVIKKYKVFFEANKQASMLVKININKGESIHNVVGGLVKNGYTSPTYIELD